MVTGGLGSRHEWATDGYFVAPKIKSFIRQFTLEDSHNLKKQLKNRATVMLVTSLCWWLYDGERFEMLVIWYIGDGILVIFQCI